MVDFQKALKKGDIGEDIVTEFLEKKGWIIYRPFTKDKAHYFDMLCTLNKEKVIVIDVKTKARLNKWAAQGINIKSYNEYLNFIEMTKVNFYLIFVDDKNGQVYLADLITLKNPIYPNSKIIAWKLDDMKYLFTISDKDIERLSKYDQRNYEFNPK
jgi:Holliday junction resolvase-like predicted endonuclease